MSFTHLTLWCWQLNWGVVENSVVDADDKDNSNDIYSIRTMYQDPSVTLFNPSPTPLRT